MGCSVTLNGIARDCTPNMGGVKRVYIGDVSILDNLSAPSDGEINIGGDLDSLGFAEYAFPRGTASMNSTATIDKASGVKYFTTEVVMQFNRMEATKRMEIMSLLSGEFAVIVLDENGKYWLIDSENALEVSAADGTTGTAIGDANKYGITLSVDSRELPYEVSGIND